MESIRNTTFDMLKGFLIILVILGHVLLGSIDSNIARKIIYFFHMPLFLAVTGYFIKSKLLDQSNFIILKKYYQRMILPYILAFVVFTSISWFYAYMGGYLELKGIINSFLYPIYHLWYIPAIIIFIFYTKGIESIQYANKFIFFTLLAFIVTIFYKLLGDTLGKGTWMEFLGDKRYYYYYYYFLLGYIISSRKSKKTIIIASVLMFPFILLTYVSLESGMIKAISFVLVLSIIIILTIVLCEYFISNKNNILSKIGSVSLPIYLWHVLPIQTLKTFFPLGGYLYYTLSCIICGILIYMFIFFENRSSILNRLFYGLPAPKKKICMGRN